jgi:hypothetical protein
MAQVVRGSQNPKAFAQVGRRTVDNEAPIPGRRHAHRAVGLRANPVTALVRVRGPPHRHPLGYSVARRRFSPISDIQKSAVAFPEPCSQELGRIHRPSPQLLSIGGRTHHPVALGKPTHPCGRLPTHACFCLTSCRSPTDPNSSNFSRNMGAFATCHRVARGRLCVRYFEKD